MHFLSEIQRSTLALTSQSDSQSLARVLIDLLTHSGWVSHAVLLEVHRHAEGGLTAPPPVLRLFDVELGIAHREVSDPRGVLECLDGGAPCAVRASGATPARIAIPIAGQLMPRRVLVLEGLSLDPMVRMQVLHLAELFGNQLALIEARERDQLTGLLNRQAFNQCYLQLASAAAGELGDQLWLALLDIDHFKQVNDNFGHLLGDEVLLRFARIMERSFRFNDRLFRFGGEEFLVLMRADEIGASVALERFRATVEGYEFPCVGRLTVSVGYASAAGVTLPPDLVDIADQALYSAKHDGRNRVVQAASQKMAQPAQVAGGVELF
ncbi:MAG: GGDEF domain-containing protein [Gammaproteobacteria bacterium]